MKKGKLITLLTLVLALLLNYACAESSAVVRGVFDALTAEGSDYNQTKAMYAEYYEGVQCEEAVEGDSIVISISNSEYMDGSWTFTQEGDYLTATFDDEDYTGPTLTMSVLQAVATYLGMDADIITGYANGLGTLGIESDEFAMAWDDAGALSVRINDTTPWDMSALDEMVLDENVVYPLDGDYTGSSASLGKMMMIANKNGDSMTILLGEYGGLDDLAYQSILNVVSILQPAGWDDFTAAYTELADVDTGLYSVKLNAESAEVAEIIDDAKDSYEYAILRFGASGQTDEASEYAFAGTWQDEVSQRASMDATQDGNHVEILVHWGGSATEAASWEISGDCDPETGSLAYEDARFTVTEWDDDGNDTVIEEKTSNGMFAWEGDKLRWTDSLNEDEGLFVKLDDGYDDGTPEPAEAPTVEEFAEGYFGVLASLESETAGASLKTAIAASEVCAFAEAHELYNPDVETMRANMLTAFEGLSEDEQIAALTNFDTIRALLDDCLEDYEDNRAIFEDAGVADTMDEVMYDPLNREAWKKLRDHTLTMGNDENEG